MENSRDSIHLNIFLILGMVFTYLRVHNLLLISPLIQNPITSHEESTRKKETNTYLILGRGGTLEAKKKWEKLQRKISKQNSNMFRYQKH